MTSYLFIYRVLFVFVRFFILPFVYFLSTLLKKLGPENKFTKTILSRRNAFNQIQKIPQFAENQRIYWFHAASGEIEYAKSIMRELKKMDPHCKILWSYSSISAESFFSSAVDVDFKFPLPFDSIQNNQRLIRILKPTVFLIARSDLWPELLFQLKKNKIPRFLFAATVSEKKSRSYSNQNVFSFLSHISCVSQEDYTNLQEMNLPGKLIQQGDPRADEVYFRTKQSRLKFDLKSKMKQKNILLLGSTWSEDEKALVEIFELENWSFVLVPHEWHAQDRQHFESFFKDKNLAFYSDIENTALSEKCDVLVVNKKGILLELYRQATAVFVGGSFKEKVHSVYEPLAWGKKVFVGPFYQNNREAVEFSKMESGGEQFVSIVHSSKELIHILRRRNHHHFAAIEKPIISEIEKKIGASTKIAKTASEL
ncbi:MAG: 3-deoxy-D-manno-octulosonic acid transferase [Pseudobdellovibrionaceae bacterium]